MAGAAVQWLRDGLHLIAKAADTEALAAAANDAAGVYLVPAFTGLGAPWWDPEARGALFGLTRDTGIADIARATRKPCHCRRATCRALARMRQHRLSCGLDAA